MFSKGVNDTSRVVRMTIVGDVHLGASLTDNSGGVIYDRKIFII
jgi:hypothetical protein